MNSLKIMLAMLVFTYFSFHSFAASQHNNILSPPQDSAQYQLEVFHIHHEVSLGSFEEGELIRYRKRGGWLIKTAKLNKISEDKVVLGEKEIEIGRLKHLEKWEDGNTRGQRILFQLGSSFLAIYGLFLFQTAITGALIFLGTALLGLGIFCLGIGLKYFVSKFFKIFWARRRIIFRAKKKVRS